MPDEMLEFVFLRDMIVTPVNDHDAGQFAVALEEMEQMIRATDDEKALEKIVYIRTILGRSARVGRNDQDTNGRTLQ